MAPRVRFLQKVQKQLSAKKAGDGTDHLKEAEQNKNSPSSMNEEEVEKCGTNFSGKVSVNKTKERRKEAEECSASSEGAEESGESEDESKEVSEDEKEEEVVPVPSRVPNPDSVQFFEGDDDDDDDDTKELDLLTVKQRDVFGVEAKDNPALVSALYSKAHASCSQKISGVTYAFNILCY